MENQVGLSTFATSGTHIFKEGGGTKKLMGPLQNKVKKKIVFVTVHRSNELFSLSFRLSGFSRVHQ